MTEQPEEHMFLDSLPMELRARAAPMTGEEIWEGICQLYGVSSRPPFQPLAPNLRIYVCPSCCGPQYAPGLCGMCAPYWAPCPSTPMTSPPLSVIASPTSPNSAETRCTRPESGC